MAVTTEGIGAAVAAAATVAMAPADNSGNGGGRRKQRCRQQWGHSTINQKAAAIAAETATEMAIVGAGDGSNKDGGSNNSCDDGNGGANSS